MTKQVQEAYIVAATRAPVGKAPRGMFRNTRPDDLLAHVLKRIIGDVPRFSISDHCRDLFKVLLWAPLKGDLIKWHM